MIEKGGITLDSLEVTHFFYNKDQAMSEGGNEEVTFETRLGFRTATEGNRVVEFVKISMRLPDEEDFCSIQAALVFSVDNIEVKVEENSITGPIELLRELASIGLSTMRGVLLERIARTPFRNHLLPVIDAERLLAEEQ